MQDGNRKGKPSKRRPTWLRVLRFVLKATASLWIFYVVVMNTFLSTSLFDRVINGEPDVIDVHYRRGWSLWPGRIVARDLSIRGRDSNVEWILRLERVTFDVSLHRLAVQKFEVTRARGSGITFRLRQRLDAEPTSPEQIAHLPPIEGLGPYAVRPPKTESPDVWHDEHYHLWQPHLEDTIAEDVREVWIDNERFEGLARIEGRFHLIPIRSVDIGPVQVTIREGRVKRGASVLAEGLDGTRASVTVGQFDPRKASGEDVLHKTSVDLEGQGTLPDLSKMPGSEAVKISGIAKVEKLAFYMHDGIVRSGSHLEMGAAPAVIRVAQHRVTAPLTLFADVTAGPEGDRLTARIEASRADVAHGDGGMVAKRAVITLESRKLDLVEPLSDAHARAELPDLELPDLRALSSYGERPIFWGGRAAGRAVVEGWLAEQRAKMDAKLRVEGLDAKIGTTSLRGGGQLAGEAAFEKGTLRGALELDAKRIEMVGAGVRSAGEGMHARVNVRDLRIGAKRAGRGEVSVRADAVRVSTPSFQVSGGVEASAAWTNWNLADNTMTVDGANATLTRVRGGDGPDLATVERITLRGVVPHMDWREPLDAAFAGRLQVTNAEVADVRTMQRFLPQGKLAILSGRARASADIALSGAQHATDGTLDIRLSRAGVRLSETVFRGDFDIAARVHGFVPGRFGESALANGMVRLVDLTGTRIRMRNIEVVHATTETSRWRGDALFEDATLRFGSRPEFHGQVTLDARDANPLLAILLRDSLPKFFSELTDMPHLVGSAQFTLSPDRLTLRNLDARGGDLSVRGLYATQDHARRGAFIVKKGPISAGVGLSENGFHIRLFDLEKWLHGESRKAPLAEEPPR